MYKMQYNTTIRFQLRALVMSDWGLQHAPLPFSIDFGKFFLNKIPDICNSLSRSLAVKANTTNTQKINENCMHIFTQLRYAVMYLFILGYSYGLVAAS